MQTRTASRIGRPLSFIGLGTWQLGADWGEVSEADARAVLEASVEGGVTVDHVDDRVAGHHGRELQAGERDLGTAAHADGAVDRTEVLWLNFKPAQNELVFT